MTDQIITIIPIGEPGISILKYIAGIIEDVFSLNTKVDLNYIIRKMPEPIHNRINSSKIISFITDNIHENIYKILIIHVMTL